MQRRTCAGARAGISDYCYVFRKLYMYYITLFISTCMIECRSNTNMVLSASERAQTDRPPFKLKEYAARGAATPYVPTHTSLYLSFATPPPYPRRTSRRTQLLSVQEMCIRRYNKLRRDHHAFAATPAYKAPVIRHPIMLFISEENLKLKYMQRHRRCITHSCSCAPAVRR
jgi:hypothetical protein